MVDLKEKVLENFKAICAVPRGSGDEKAISDYICSFARERGFEAKQDEHFNVTVKIPGTCGKENNPAVALQGHLDMVYVKTAESPHVYEEGIKTKIEGDMMSSTMNTSLGADDGMAVAYCMTLMEDMTIPHPPLEILLTVLEEVGLTGAQKFDCSDLKAKYFINLDSEREGEFFTSCAGGVRNNFTIPVKKEEAAGLKTYSIQLKGLKGGHSGMDIHKGRANAIKVLGRILKYSDSENVHLVSFCHNGKANVIPQICDAKVGVRPDCAESFLSALKSNFQILKNEFAYSDSMELDVRETEAVSLCYDSSSKEKLYDALTLLPYGMISKSFVMENLTETSVNIGSCDEEEDRIVILSSARSAVRSKKMELIEKIDTAAGLLGCKSECFSDYPQWDYNPDSPLRELAMKSYKKLTGKDGVCAAVHAGLECGYFHEKMPDCDMLSIGCDIFDVHSVNERVSVSSFMNVWELLLEILKEL